jgi:hypothetical protein
MRRRHYRLPYIVAASLSLLLPALLAGCGPSRGDQKILADATTVPAEPPKTVAVEPQEGIDTESTIFTWLGMAKRPSQQRGPRVGPDVSPSLWLAAHDTLNFVQIASEEPQTGLLITDWYSPRGKPEERLRVTVFIASYALRSDSLQVTVERQVRGKDGQWTDSTVDRKTVTDLETAILLRARQIHAETYRNEVMSQ